MEIWVPILVACIIGLICGVGLSVASSVMAVKEDERFPAIRGCLPGANCGACGFTGCDGYAKALLQPGTKTNLCVPGGAEAAKKLAAVLGVEAEETVRNVAVVKCSGTCDVTQPKEEYRGIHTCSAAKLLFGGPGSCTYGCIGYGDCAAVCPQKAISIERGVAFVDAAELHRLRPVRQAVPAGRDRAGAGDGEIRCRVLKPRQGRDDAQGVFDRVYRLHEVREKLRSTMRSPSSGNLAAIDYAKCTGCGKCAEVCTTGCIRLVDLAVHA